MSSQCSAGSNHAWGVTSRCKEHVTHGSIYCSTHLVEALARVELVRKDAECLGEVVISRRTPQPETAA